MTRRRRQSDGFTLIEVMVAVLIAMVGLLGSVAVQQTIMNASRNASEGAIATRLATQALEEMQTRVTSAVPIVIDQFAGIATNAWSPPEYLDTNGRRGAALSPANRFVRRVRVKDNGVGLPYNISVQVSYALDAPTPKVVQLDVERRKTW